MSAQQDIESILEALVARGGPIHADQVGDILRNYRAMKQMYPEPGSVTLFVDAMRMFIGHIGSAMGEQRPGSGSPQGNLMLQRMTWGLERMQAQLNGQPGNPATPVPGRAREGLLAQRPEAVASGQRNPTIAERITDEIQTQYGCSRTEALLYVQQNGEENGARAIDLDCTVTHIAIDMGSGARLACARADPVQIHDDGSAAFGPFEIEPSGVERGERLKSFYPRLPLSVAIFAVCGVSPQLLDEMCSPAFVTRTFTDGNGRDWTVRNEAYHPSEDAPIGYVPPVAHMVLPTVTPEPQEDVIRRPVRDRQWRMPAAAAHISVAENTFEAQLNGHSVSVQRIRLSDGDQFEVVQALEIVNPEMTTIRIAGPFLTEIEARAWMSKLYYVRGTDGHRG